MIVLKCENMFAMLILNALILHSGNNIEILSNPSPSIILKFSKHQCCDLMTASIVVVR